MPVYKLNESALYQLGFDRVAIDAFRHLLNQVGNNADTETLAALIVRVNELFGQVQGGSEAPPTPELMPQQGDQAPTPQAMIAAVEYLEAQLQALREVVTLQSRRINDLEQGHIL